MNKPHLIKSIGQYELWVEELNFGKQEYMFSVNYNGDSVESMASSIIGYWDTKKDLVKNINDFIKRYTTKDGFHPFIVSE